jgi:hypothetical protein
LHSCNRLSADDQFDPLAFPAREREHGSPPDPVERVEPVTNASQLGDCHVERVRSGDGISSADTTID